MPGMYLDALSFLEDERDAFRPYEALLELTDEQLDVPVAAAHGWSGRDLMGHLLDGHQVALAVAKELAVGEASGTMERHDAEWAIPGRGDELNHAAIELFRALPMMEARQRFRETAGELRGYLTVVPEARWLKRADRQDWFLGETLEHYEDHAADLRAILEAAGS
jgi:hypothetical protein